LAKFKAEGERLGLDRLEELYANTFDLQADCSLFAGYHLFGEDWRRSLFLVELKERYQTCGFSCGHEVPDHVVVLLRFLSVQTDPKEEMALLEDCLLPVASRVAARLDPAHNPYRAALDALLLRLRGQGGNGGACDDSIPQPQGAVR
jgi:nitrate reductase delta subunit